MRDLGWWRREVLEGDIAVRFSLALRTDGGGCVAERSAKKSVVGAAKEARPTVVVMDQKGRATEEASQRVELGMEHIHLGEESKVEIERVEEWRRGSRSGGLRLKRHHSALRRQKW
jgi:hypothetical protein